MSWMLTMYFLFLLSRGTSASTEDMVISWNGQKPAVIIAEEGESVNITCRCNYQIKSLYLKRTLGREWNIMYAANHGKTKREDPEYKNRIEYFQLNNIAATIRLQKLKKEDSDVYECVGTLQVNNNDNSRNSNKIVLAVKGKEDSTAVKEKEDCMVETGVPELKLAQSSSSSWMLYVLIFLSLLLVSALGYFIFSHIDIKKYCKKGKGKEAQTTVYEDMTCSLRHNTMVKPNPYCTA